MLLSIVNLEGGGAERVVSNLTRGLDGWEVHLALFENDIGYPYDGELHVLDIDVHADSAPGKLYELGRGLVRMRRLKRRIAPDVSLSFLLWPNVLNILSSTGRSERVLASVRNSRSDALLDTNGIIRATGYRMLIEAVYNRADGIIAISEGVGRDLATNFGVAPAATRTIYNPVGVDAIRREAARSVPGPFAEVFADPTVVTVGRFVDQKGQWHLIRAFRRTAERLDDRARLVLLGKGPLKDYLLDLAEDLGLSTWHRRRDPPEAVGEARVVFAGFRDNPHSFMERASLFAFPSISEGLGNVLIEALACGTATVASDCDYGPREILAPATDSRRRTRRAKQVEYGVLMPAPDGQSYGADEPLTGVETTWADTMTTLLADPARRATVADAGRRRAEDFRRDAIVDQWEATL
ncbi:MAG: glycosyltransferase [Bradymonadaceae bacterium]